MSELKFARLPTLFYQFRTHDPFGRKYLKPQKQIATCKDCNCCFTSYCPMEFKGIDLDMDYCSRFVHKK